MPSSFSWLDYSEHDRRRTLDVVDMFRERDSRDELGIGTVRDAFADLLFPGTSTIQTRGRYFLFIPWIYQKLEQQQVPSSQIAQKARASETRLINILKQSDDILGIIGARAGGAVKRLASNVYWQGLGIWGLRLYNGSQDQYHRSLVTYYRTQKGRIISDDGELTDKEVANWVHLPPAPNGFPENATFKLGPQESRFLIERILARCPDSLLAFLVDRDGTLTKGKFPWELPETSELSHRLQEQLDHARNFSIAIYGASLLYNLILAEKIQGSAELVEIYWDSMDDWVATLNNYQPELADWDRQRFWAILDGTDARIPRLTRTFINQWLDWTLTEPENLAKNEQARTMIANRERYLKGNQSRIHNPRALEMWSGHAGTARLDYRWYTVQTIIGDILQGITEEVEHA